MQFDGLRSDNKVPENRIKTDRVKFIKNEFQNNNNLLAHHYLIVMSLDIYQIQEALIENSCLSLQHQQ